MIENISDSPPFRENLIRFAALLFKTMADKYGASITLNELLMLNYGFVCHANGEDICVTKASEDLKMAKSTVSRILTEMRAKKFINERVHPSDRRRRIFKLADTHLAKGNADIEMLLRWCSFPGNALR